MLCKRCRRHLDREAEVCRACGTPRAGGEPPLELVLADGSRVPLLGEELVIGRAPGSSLQLDDPSVSRRHARIAPGVRGGGPEVSDAGSSHGTFLDGARLETPRPLRAGSALQLGNLRLTVERRPAQTGAVAGRTLVVPAGASLVVPAVGSPAVVPAAARDGMRPRLRSGYALKRLDASEGHRRVILSDLEGGGFLRLSDRDADLLELLDGTRALPTLVTEAEVRSGATGPARLARLLADLGDRGLLAGVSGAAAAEGDEGRLRRLLAPRRRTWDGAGETLDRLYGRGGWALFTAPALWAIAVLSVVGVGVFGYLIAERYGTPFVVASKLGLGGIVFLAGRFAVVMVHEVAHGLAMAFFGRRVRTAGVKLIVVFPYAYVDTSEAWFEPRRRRMAISAAGPVSDLALGGAFAIACLLLAPGAVRDVCFQVALGAYIGAFFNLNPFLDRDGYHILVDALREPGLRARARDQLSARLSGRGPGEGSRVLGRYAVAGLGWSVVAAIFAIVISLRYAPLLEELAPRALVYVVLGTLWTALFFPVVVVIGRPLLGRLRGGKARPA